MINVDMPIKAENMETLIERLDEENGSSGFVFEHAGFVDLNEPAIMDNFIYRYMQNECKYAVRHGHL